MRALVTAVLGCAMLLQPVTSHAQQSRDAASIGNGAADRHSHHRASAGSTAEPAVAALMDSVRTATAHLRTRDAAARAGYRRVGIDFPAMGEHWVNPGILVRYGLDPLKPAILTYTDVGGEHSLTGVVFAVALNPGESAPLLAGLQRPWHEHNGSVSDESLIRQHDADEAATGRRLAVLHLWTEVPNPTGPFATENWALPFARLGLAIPDPVPVHAARALSLIRGGDQYFQELIAATGEQRKRLDALFVSTRDMVSSVVEPALRDGELAHSALRALETIWLQLGEEVARVCGGCAEELLSR